MSFQCAVLQTAVSNRGFPWPLRQEWPPSRPGVSAIIPLNCHRLQQYWANSLPVCSNCYRCTAVGFLSLWQIQGRLQMLWCCVLLRPHSVLFVSERCLCRLWPPSKRAELFLFVCSLGLKQHWTIYSCPGQLLLRGSELGAFYSHAHMWHTDVPSTSSPGRSCLAISSTL